jgi:hypothetical protein
MKIIDYSAKAIAVVGDTKPIKNELKKLGGKFNPRLSCGAGWIFSAKKREEVEKLLSLGIVPEKSSEKAQKQRTINDNELLDEYVAEHARHAQGEYLDYFRKKFSYAIRLTNGGILAFEKPNIKTSFCFGYSLSMSDTEDYDNANKMAEYASKNEDYFLTKNLEDYDKQIEAFETGKIDGFSEAYICIHRQCYSDTSLNVWDLNIFHHWTFEEQKEYGDKYGMEYQLVNDTDKAAILAALKHEREKFEKRLKTYLKRYGTSKLKTWSYWRDA